MAGPTIEEMIVSMERKGWRISHLSHIRGSNQYSCILERKKMGDDGFPVYAMNKQSLDCTATEAVAGAWANAQQPLNNPRVARMIGADRVQHTDLSRWLSNNLGYRLRLEDALEAWEKALTGETDDADDFL